MSYMYGYDNLMKDDSLEHHGIKGQKWGVRRYQNPDGTLTSDGKKRYGKMSGEKLYKTLKKQVQSKRAEQHGQSNRWMSQLSIGENSKRLIEDKRQKRKEYESSDAYKEWEKKVDKLSKEEYDDTYDDRFESLMKEKPKKTFDDISYAIVYGRNGREYSDNFLRKGGKELSMAYLKDLGYNDEISKEFVEKMIKANRTIGTI